MSSLLILLPELLVVAGAVAAILLAGSGRFQPVSRTVLLAVLLTALLVELTVGGQLVTLLPGLYRQDRFALFAKAVLLLGAAVAVLAGGRRAPTAPRQAPAGPSLAGSIGLFVSCLAGMLAVSSPSLLPLILWLEAGIAANLLLSRRAGRPPQSQEWLLALGSGLAAVAGSLAIHGLAGTNSLDALRNRGAGLGVGLAIALLLMVVALASQVLAGRRFGPLAGAMAGLALIKFMAALSGDAAAWGILLPALAALLMLVAAVGALSPGGTALLAWAGVLQIGWVLAGLAAGGRAGFAASLFLFGAFVIASSADALPEPGQPGGGPLPHAGRGRAFGLTSSLLTLAGLPPLAGFFGLIAVGSQLALGGYFWLIGVGLLGTTVVAFSAVREMRLTFLGPDRPGVAAGEPPGHGLADRHLRAGGVLTGLLLVAYVVFANPISGLAIQGAVAAGAR